MINAYLILSLAVVIVSGGAADSWQVKGSDGVICLLLNGTFKFTIQYPNATGHSVQRVVEVPRSNETLTNGVCRNDTDAINVQFFGKSWIFGMHFKRDDKKYSVVEMGLAFTISRDIFPDAKDLNKTVTMSKMDMDLWNAEVNTSYMCESSAKIENFTSVNNQTVAGVRLMSVDMSDIQVEAFRTSHNTKFSEATSCPADVDKISNIVPIVVGAALAGFVVIVLIAYLIGRRKSKRGYESV